MMDHSMATTTNNGGGSKNHLSSLLDGSAYRQAYYGQNSGDPADTKENVTPIVFVVVTGVVVLLRLLCSRMRKEEDGGGDGLDQPPLPSSRAGGLADTNPSAVADMEAVPTRVADPPLVCTYRKADGWGDDDACGVCLAELADGEALRVLPACMHFFHATCLNEWLRGHDTCPLCRTPLVTSSDAS